MPPELLFIKRSCFLLLLSQSVIIDLAVGTKSSRLPHSALQSSYLVKHGSYLVNCHLSSCLFLVFWSKEEAFVVYETQHNTLQRTWLQMDDISESHNKDTEPRRDREANKILPTLTAATIKLHQSGPCPFPVFRLRSKMLPKNEREHHPTLQRVLPTGCGELSDVGLTV